MSHRIEFIEETHTYVVDGIIVPSITQLIKKYLGEKYIGVDEEVLKTAAIRGSTIHKDIELWVKGKKPSPDTIEGGYAKEILENYGIKPDLAEIVVALENPNTHKVVAAGTIDMIAIRDNKIWLIDHKTTCSFDYQYSYIQNNLYAMAFEQECEIGIQKLGVLWLKEGKHKELKVIEKNYQDVWNKIETVLNEKEDNNLPL